VSAYVYLEGGASGTGSKYLNTKCQEAFHKLLDRMGFHRKPRLVACPRIKGALETLENVRVLVFPPKL
jgi:hypothetical protein